MARKVPNDVKPGDQLVATYQRDAREFSGRLQFYSDAYDALAWAGDKTILVMKVIRVARVEEEEDG